MPIDIAAPYSDGWWLQRLYKQLQVQQKRCQELQSRVEGDSPLPFVSDIQRDAVKWFVQKSRTNFERLIVNAVLSRLRIVGMRTAVDNDEGGDKEAFNQWKKARGKLFSLDAHKMALSMSKAYVIVGKDAAGNLAVTAEDPRFMTAITDPLDPYKVVAALKLFYDDVAQADMAYLYLPGRVMVARRERQHAPTKSSVSFSAAAFDWDLDGFDEAGEMVRTGLSGPIDGLATFDELGTLTGGEVPVVPFENEDGMAEFEPFITSIDRINQQILQRMTIATIQAFKQRAFKGLPQTDPKTGEAIDYDAVFVADPGAIWNVPASVEIWESGVVDLGPILLAIRDDIKDLMATSGTPLYTVTPDAANGSAEGASLQREQIVFKIVTRQDRWEPSHERVGQLMFMTLNDAERSEPGTIEIIWAPAQTFSVTERANAIAQTKGVISRYQQVTEIWGMDPSQADRNASELTGDFILDQQYAVAANSGNNN